MRSPQLEDEIVTILNDVDFNEGIHKMLSLYPDSVVQRDIVLGDVLSTLKQQINLIREATTKDKLKDIPLQTLETISQSLTQTQKYFNRWREQGYVSPENIFNRYPIPDAVKTLEAAAQILVPLLTGQADYKAELQKILVLKNDAEKATALLATITHLANQSAELAEDISRSNEKAGGVLISIENLLKQAQEDENATHREREAAEGERKIITENRQEIENSREKIVAFQNNIEDTKTEISNQLTKLKEAIELLDTEHKTYKQKLQDDSNTVLASHKTETDTIIKNNTDYQKRINDLLQGANAGKLNETYNAQVTAIEKQLNLWAGAIIITTLAILCISVGAFYVLKADSFWHVLAERALLITPLLLLDVFIVFQYNKRHQLLEEYRYRSTVALSLFSFNEMVKANNKDDIQLKFITGAIEKMYESPFKEDDFTKGQKEMLKTLMNKIGEKADKVVDKVIENQTGKPAGS